MFCDSGYTTLRKWFMSFVASVISEHDTYIHCQHECVIVGAAIGRGIIDIKIITFWPDEKTSLSLRHEWLPRSNLIPDPQFVTAPHLASAHSCSVMIAAGLNCSTSKDSLCAATSKKTMKLVTGKSCWWETLWNLQAIQCIASGITDSTGNLPYHVQEPDPGSGGNYEKNKKKKKKLEKKSVWLEGLVRRGEILWEKGRLKILTFQQPFTWNW